MRLVSVWFIATSWWFCHPHPWVSAQECAEDGVCDTHERCSAWREQGECYRNVDYMAEHCPVACRNATRRINGCADVHPRCAVWAQVGECEENPEDMHRYCAKSCKVCGTTEPDEPAAEDTSNLCVDKHENCGFWASKGECKANPRYMENYCSKSCGTCTNIKRKLATSTSTSTSATDDSFKAMLEKTRDFGELQRSDGRDADKTAERIIKSIQYMSSQQTQSLPQSVLQNCLNRNELCSFWAVVGECEKNRAYMVTNCAPACMSCEMIDMDKRCPPLENPMPALRPGSLNKMFERIVDTAPGNRTLTDDERRDLAAKNMTEYTVTVHSRPSTSPATEVSIVLDQSLPPWVISFDNFLTQDEADVLIQLGYQHGYKRSEDVGKQRFDGSFDGMKNEGRTSENAWCSSHNKCRFETVPQRIHQRIADVLAIPPQNSEDFQLLKYEVGQFYRTHHDYIGHQRDRQGGPRILTFFMYLSDVESGGGTNFPQLGITIQPKQGRALLWPSVLDSHPLSKDDRMMHQALPPEAGTKFAANGWIHMYDYQAAQAKGCN